MKTHMECCGLHLQIWSSIIVASANLIGLKVAIHILSGSALSILNPIRAPEIQLQSTRLQFRSILVTDILQEVLRSPRWLLRLWNEISTHLSFGLCPLHEVKNVLLLLTRPWRMSNVLLDTYFRCYIIVNMKIIATTNNVGSEQWWGLAILAFTQFCLCQRKRKGRNASGQIRTGSSLSRPRDLHGRPLDWRLDNLQSPCGRGAGNQTSLVQQVASHLTGWAVPIHSFS